MHASIMLPILLAVASAAALASARNVSIDDTAPAWVYDPPGNWGIVSASNPCTTCASQPDPSLAHSQTWRDCSSTGELRSHRRYRILTASTRHSDTHFHWNGSHDLYDLSWYAQIIAAHLSHVSQCTTSTPCKWHLRCKSLVRLVHYQRVCTADRISTVSR